VEVVAASPSDGSGGSVDVGQSDASSSDDANPLPFLGLHVVLLAFLAAAVRR
jgi:hypothetical protein